MFISYLNPLLDIARRIETEVTQGAFIWIHSTATKSALGMENILNHKQHVVYVLYRYFGLEKQKYRARQTRALSSCKKRCIDAERMFCDQKFDTRLHEASSVEIVKLSKITENLCRFIDTVSAEELEIFYGRSGFGFHEPQQRWKKGSIRTNFFVSTFFWQRRHPLMTLTYYLEFMSTFSAPILAFAVLIYEPLIRNEFAYPMLILGSSIFLEGLALGLDYKLRDPSVKKNWLYKPMMNLITNFVLSWLLFPALWNLRKNNWGTR